MTLTDWAAREGVSYLTALRWFHAGCLPVPATQPRPRGKIIVNPPSELRVIVVGREDGLADTLREALAQPIATEAS